MIIFSLPRQENKIRSVFTKLSEMLCCDVEAALKASIII